MALIYRKKTLSPCPVCKVHVRTVSLIQHQLSCFNFHLTNIEELGIAQCQHDPNHIIPKEELDDHELYTCSRVRDKMRALSWGLTQAIIGRKSSEYMDNVKRIETEQSKIREGLIKGRLLVKQLQKDQIRAIFDNKRRIKDMERDIYEDEGPSGAPGKKKKRTDIQEEERTREYFAKRKQEAEKEADTLNISLDQIDPNNFLQPSTFNPSFEDMKPNLPFRPTAIFANFSELNKPVTKVDIKEEKVDD